MRNRILMRFSDGIRTFFRGIHAQKNMRHLLVLANDAAAYHSSAEWHTALSQINTILSKEKCKIQHELDYWNSCGSDFSKLRSRLKADTPRRLRVCIPNALADIVFPKSFFTYTIKYLYICCQYREFFFELFPEMPYELFGKQIRRR